LITGAGSGLGRQLALAYAARGHAIAALDLRPDALAQLEHEVKQQGASCAWLVADVTDAAGLAAAAGELESRLGPFVLLLPSAGVGMETSALAFRAGDFETVVRVNLIGVANAVAAVLPGMLERKRGHIVGISSLASFAGLPLMAGYCASKAGVNVLMEALRIELAPHGIAVTTVCPGWIRTPMTAHLQDRIRDMMSVEEAVQQIIAAIDRRDPLRAFPRAPIRRLKLLRWLPASWRDRLLRKMMERVKDAAP
jgi:short-subunit dehydrogenase